MNGNLGQKAKETLEEYTPVVFEQLRKYFEEELALGFGFNQRQKEVVRELLRHAQEFNIRPSKTLRASFVHYGYLLGGSQPDERIWKAAMSVQVVHAALLMHDDFMDRDALRRGGPTTHKYYEGKAGGDEHYGESMAVTVGDVGICLGFELLLNCGFEGDKVEKALRQLLRGITNTAYGQVYDLTLEQLGRWTEEDVIALHRAKTAIYTYENPLFIGAHLADLSQEVFQILHDYAMDGGVAFQLQDDILGVYGDEEKTGKSADSDLRQGKCTLLVLKVFTDGTKSQKQAVREIWGKYDEAKKQDIDLAKQAIMDSGSYGYSRQLAKEYAAKAAKTAEKLRGLELNLEAIDYIQGIAEYMVEREV